MQEGKTPLMLAAGQGHDGIVTILIHDAHADLEAKSAVSY